MKEIQIKLVVAIWLALHLMGCEPNENVVPIDENQGKEKIELVFSLQGAPGENAVILPGNYKAKLHILNAQGQDVYKNDALNLVVHQGKLKTSPLNIKEGSYLIEDLVVYNESNEVICLLPKIGSPKAIELEFQLPVAFIVEEKTEVQEAQSVIAMAAETDLPHDFGIIDEMAFGNRPYYITKLNLDVVVGNVHYDDLNTTVTFSARKTGLESFHKNYSLTHGKVDLWLPKKYDEQLDLLIQHWGQNFEVSLASAEFFGKEEVKVSFEHRVKRLKSTTRYVIPLNSTEEYFSLAYEFNYNAKGKLISRSAHQKRPGESVPSITSISDFTYDAFGRMAGIDQKNPDGQSYGFETYFYDVFDRVSKIRSVNSAAAADITADFNYDTDEAKHPKNIHYRFVNGPIQTYNFRFERENLLNMPNSKVEDVYDNMINPFAVMNYVDFYLRYSSKNNEVKAEQVSYSGGFPDVVQDQSVYVYDEDGYPIEKKTSIKGYTSGNLLYHEKTVYEYWD